MHTAFPLTAIGSLLLLASSSFAQGPSFRPGPGGTSGVGPTSPAVSPYLNLNRRGSSVAVNYYGLVRPAIDFQNSLNTLQQQVTDLPTPGTGGLGTDQFSPLLTGNRPRYLNTGNYFLSNVSSGFGRGGGGSGGGSGPIVVFNQQQSSQSTGGSTGGRSSGSTPMTSSGPKR
ncbi:MAG: hypothetical protein K8T89_10410 [Planctomycetes bacterium]|nr:hypothetical protein [Planctomycetota bacterium]